MHLTDELAASNFELPYPDFDFFLVDHDKLFVLNEGMSVLLLSAEGGIGSCGGLVARCKRGRAPR